jgi:hypothetical protein
MLPLLACANPGDGSESNRTPGGESADEESGEPEESAVDPVDTAAAASDPNPTGAWSGGVAFEEVTSAWGLDGVTGGRFSAGDLDGDGWLDLLVTEVFSNARDDVEAGVYYHRLMRNTGAGAFEDVTESSGILTNFEGGAGHAGTTAVFADVDGDRDLDVFYGRYMDEGDTDATGDRNELYLNDGSGRFTLSTGAGVRNEDPYPTTGATFTDYDGDGDADLFVDGWYPDYGADYGGIDALLYRNDGHGVFEEVAADLGIDLNRLNSLAAFPDRGRVRPSFGATACDTSGDGYPDLIQSNYGRSWNFLWQSDAGAAFTEVGEAVGVDADDNIDYRDDQSYACHCEAYGPCDPEPTVDCQVANFSDYWYSGYSDVEAHLAGNTFTTMCGDLDNDGDLDLMHTEISHWWAGASSDATQILENDGTGTFTRLEPSAVGMDREHESVDWNRGDIYGAFFDFDNDMWQDILIVSTDYPDQHLWLFRQVAPMQFEDVSTEAGLDQDWPYGVAVADFDGDGDLDVATGSSTARSGTPWTDHAAHLYENRQGGNWIEVEAPLSSRVSVRVGNVTQTAEVQGGYGTFGIENGTAVHFGLGETDIVDELTVTPAGGQPTTWTRLIGNRTFDAR